MSSARAATIFAFLAAGLGIVFLLQKPQGQPVGIKMELPEYVGRWYGVAAEVTQREREILASDTAFARKRYSNGTGDVILASIVLSGQDLDNSIHRPERCLPAQGLTIIASTPGSVDVPPHRLPITRLKDVRDVRGPNGKPIPLYNLNYYWFVGYNRVTASHIERTLFDISDRILRGYNQRWAFVTVSADITSGVAQFGRSEQQTDAMLADFIQQLAPAIIY